VGLSNLKATFGFKFVPPMYNFLEDDLYKNITGLSTFTVSDNYSEGMIDSELYTNLKEVSILYVDIRKIR
jgi:hypothetical protein